jgi:alpha-galactosidase
VDYGANITLKPGRDLLHSAQFPLRICWRFLRAAAHLVERAAERRLGTAEAVEEAYNVSWCGWGYEFNVTPAQMLGTVPKLKEMGIKWVTLDDRWFDTYGDWNPRHDTFPAIPSRR